MMDEHWPEEFHTAADSGRGAEGEMNYGKS